MSGSSWRGGPACAVEEKLPTCLLPFLPGTVLSILALHQPKWSPWERGRSMAVLIKPASESLAANMTAPPLTGRPVPHRPPVAASVTLSTPSGVWLLKQPEGAVG